MGVDGIISRLLVDLSELAEAVAVGADDLGLVLPRRVRPQRRACLPDEPGAVALRAPANMCHGLYTCMHGVWN